MFVILLSCNPLSEGQQGSFKGQYYKPGLANTEFSESWLLNSSTSSEYIYENSEVELIDNSARLRAGLRVGFDGGSHLGVSLDSDNNFLRLSEPGSTNYQELSSHWTPEWSSIRGYWKFNGSPGNLADGTTVPATLGPSGQVVNLDNSGASLVAGKFNEAIDFSGPLDYAQIPVTDWTASQYSISLWVKANSLGQSINSSVFNNFKNFGVGGTEDSFQIDVDGTNPGNYRILINTTGVVLGPVSTNWQHLTVTYDGATLQTYMNGVSSNSLNLPPHLAGTFFRDYIIGINRNGDKFFNGQVDELAVWEKALSPAAVQIIYEHQESKYAGVFSSRVMDAFSTDGEWNKLSWVPTLPFLKELPAESESSNDYSALSNDDLMQGLMGIWHMNEAAGTSGAGSIIDASSLGNHGTPYGGTVFGAGGKFKNSASFNGTSSYVALPMDVSMGAVDYQGSISFWAMGSGVAVGTNRTSSSQAGVFNIRVLNTEFTYTLCDRLSNPYCTYLTVNTPIDTLKWNHFVFTGDGSGNYQLSVNGVITSFYQSFNNLGVTFKKILIGHNHNHIWGDTYFKGNIDEVTLWNRALDEDEIIQLYRRGANRVKFQMRNCSSSACSEDPQGANWKGTFSELNNPTAGLPVLDFDDLTDPILTSRYFQYRVLLESDDVGNSCDYGSGPTWCSPELVSVKVDPVHFPATALIVGSRGVSFRTLNNFTAEYGSEGCSGRVQFNLGIGATSGTAVWYWWNGNSWSTADGTFSQANSAEEIAENLSSLTSEANSKTVFFRAFLESTESSGCSLKKVSLEGLR